MKKTEKELEIARPLMRLAGVFVAFTELAIIFEISFIFFAIIKKEEYGFSFFLISIILYFIYLFVIYKKEGRTISQKIQKIYIINENGEGIDFKGFLRRLFSKFIVFAFWFAFWVVLVFFVFFLDDAKNKMESILKTAFFLSFFSSFLLLFPVLSSKRQTFYDYLSGTLVLINYKGIQVEEREHIKKLIEHPFLIQYLRYGSLIAPPSVRLVVLIILFVVKIFKKKNNFKI